MKKDEYKELPSSIRSNVIDSGSLREITRLFVYPFLAIKPENFGFSPWLELIWGARTRRIVRYKAKEQIQINGILKNPPPFHSPHVNPILKDEEVWIRTDKTMPNRIDIETHFHGVDSEYYLVNFEEYERILKKLEVTEDYWDPWEAIQETND